MATLNFKKPMLAKSFDARHVTFPCFVQPKLDGIRCVTDGRTFWSRNGKKFPSRTMKRLRSPKRLPFLVDGELFIENASFEDIVSGTKNASTDDVRLAKQLQLRIFDIMDFKQSFESRWKELLHIFAKKKLVPLTWRLVETYGADDVLELMRLHKRLLGSGHEGSMVRKAKGLYVSKRTVNLLKLKPLLSAEFKIVRVKEARGKDKGTPVYICQSKGGEFAARPMGTMKQRRAMWRNRKKDIGKSLTVEFQNLTKYGKPRFPRAKVLRDYE